jgi:SAM-dependent methyltransferase
LTSPGDTARAASSDAVPWDEVYATRNPTLLSWYQRDPAVSLRLVESRADTGAAIVEVGAGASTLADHLVARGYHDLTLVDLSRAALDLVTARLGDVAGVRTVIADVRSWIPSRRYDLWHDRALFHFLADPEDQRRYVRVAAEALGPGGVVVLGTFAEDGPTHCSGRPVARHGAADLAKTFAPTFTLAASERELHRTPSGAVQPFTWVVLERA